MHLALILTPGDVLAIALFLAALVGLTALWLEHRRARVVPWTLERLSSQPGRVEAIATVVYEANRAYCAGLGDLSLEPWMDTPVSHRERVRDGVRWRLQNPDAPPSAGHENFLRALMAEGGWTYGPVKDVANKVHPCYLPYRKLPPEQKVKDSLFRSIVNTLGAQP